MSPLQKQSFYSLFLLFSCDHRLKSHNLGMAAEAGLGEHRPEASKIDLLSRFGFMGCLDAVLTDGVSEGKVELGLGLSMGGCFGVETEMNRLIRASSISGLFKYDDDGIVQPGVRTCSQPMENKEEIRKRKGVQSSKQLEAKRRRLEKKELRVGAKHDSDGSSGLSDSNCRLEHGSDSCKELELSSSSIPLLFNQANFIIPVEDKQSRKTFNGAKPIVSIEEYKQSKNKFDITDKAKELERSGKGSYVCLLKVMVLMET